MSKTSNKLNKLVVLNLGLFRLQTNIEITFDKGIRFTLYNADDNINYPKNSIICTGWFSENSVKTSEDNVIFHLFMTKIQSELTVFFTGLIVDETITFNAHKRIKKLFDKDNIGMIDVNGRMISTYYVIKSTFSDFEIREISPRKFITNSHLDW